MKKISVVLLSGILLLTGCSGHTTSVENGDKTLMTIGETSYTKNDEYELLKTSSGADTAISKIEQMIYDKEVGRGKKIQKQAKKQYKTYEESTDDLLSQIKSAGYEDKQDFIDNSIIPTIQADKLLDKYFKADKKNIKKTYKPSVAKILECDDEATAKKALKALKNGKKVNKVFKQYQSESSSFSNDDTLITTETSSVPTRLINTLYKTKKAGVIDEVFMDEDDDDSSTAYVAILVNNDYDEILDQVKDSLSSNSDLQTSCLVYYLNKYDFEVHDQDIFDYLKENYPQYLVNHPELSEDDDE